MTVKGGADSGFKVLLFKANSSLINFNSEGFWGFGVLGVIDIFSSGLCSFHSWQASIITSLAKIDKFVIIIFE